MVTWQFCEIRVEADRVTGKIPRYQTEKSVDKKALILQPKKNNN